MAKISKQWFVRHKIWTAAIAVVLTASIASAAGNSKKATPKTNTTSTGAMATAPESAPQDTHPHFSDGAYKIGTDIQPGTYRTREASSGCYWERMKDFSGGIDSILANDNTNAPVVVTILTSDAGFKSSNCGTWTQDLSSITTSQTSFGNGIFIVGTDMRAGTYRSSGETGCYYARLADFTGGTDSIIANDNTDNSAIVSISASDKGFESKNCGTWTLSQ